LKNAFNDLAGNTIAIGMERGTGGSNFLLHLGLGLRNLLLGAFASVRHGCGTSIDRLLAAGIQSFEDGQPRVAESRLIFSRAGCGNGDICARLLDRSLGSLAALGQYGL
jgi:hypothetical protein